MPYNIVGEQRNTGRTHFKKGFTPWNKNRIGIYSDETRGKIGEATRNRLLENHPFKGKHHSEETKNKIRKNVSISLLGNTRTKGKPWSENRRKAQTLVVRKQNQRQKPRTKPIIKNGKEYSPFWNELRKLIYRRDNWTCQECGIKCHSKISCHHIDYDIQNNNPSNLVTLCSSCHAKTNFKRTDWINHFEIRTIGV